MYRHSDHQPVTPGGDASQHGEFDSRPRVIALLLDRLTQARIKTITGGRRTELVLVATVEELSSAVRSGYRVATVICEARDAAGVPTTPLLREIRERHPAIAIIGYHPKRGSSSDILALANAGIDELLQEGIDDEGVALQAAYRGSIEACAARQVLAAVGDVIPPALLPVAQYCLRFPREDHSVEGLARAQGVDRKTLLNYARRNDFLAPSTLAAWCRILLAAALLEATRDTVEQVAFALDFGSPSAFRNVCRRYAQQRPSTWRRLGGLDAVVQLFLSAAREAPALLESSSD